MNGIITDIQKFSLHDGAGIRTTVFFKGCNLRCTWCHNPETIDMKPEKMFYQSKCIGCGHCADYCPTGARIVAGKERSAASVFEELSSDIPYYRASGGGVTLSGGEPMMQPEFAAELLRLCKEADVPTAMETNLSMPWENYEKALPWLDQVFFDIKLMDEEKHREYTGASNHTVLQNARRLAETGKPALVRTPLIPGATATRENVAAIAAFVGTLPNVTAYELLNYNPLGESKYQATGRTYAFQGCKPLPKAEVEMLAKAAEGCGVRVLYGQE